MYPMYLMYLMYRSTWSLGEKKIGLKNMTCKDQHWTRSPTLRTRLLPANPAFACGYTVGTCKIIPS